VRVEPFESNQIVDHASVSCAGAIEWDYDRTELIADGVIHAIGVSLGLAAVAVLLGLTVVNATSLDAIAVAVYGVALASTLILSAIYNLWPVCPAKWLLRRLDHSAIYVLIAATYTPFISEMDNGPLAGALLLGVWCVATLGIAMKLALPGRFDRLSIALYLVMGWSGVTLYHALLADLPTLAIRLVVAGGMLYTAGVPFHIWQRLRFQNAIWHFFVLIGAACHYAAVMDLVLT
jgi:hemolysin III